MTNLIEVADQATFVQYRRQAEIERRVGSALMKTYPTRDWYVDSDVYGGVLEVKCSSISMKYGMIVHLHYSTEEVVKRAVKAAGELLERFRLGRQRLNKGTDEGDLQRNAMGEVITAAAGEA